MADMTDAGIEERSRLESQMVEKVMRDDAFRQVMLADPRAAIAQELGIAIPDYVKITVHEEKVDDMHLVIPYMMRSSANGELSDADLEAVAGGYPSYGGGQPSDPCSDPEYARNHTEVCCS